MNQFQMKSEIMPTPDGTHLVRVVMQFGPIANVLILSPDDMEQVCVQFADMAARTIPEARRMNAMRGFQIVSGDAMPTLPPINGHRGPIVEG